MNTIKIPTNLKLITSKNVPTTTNLEKGEIAFGKIGTEDDIRLFANPDNEVKEITPIKLHNGLSGRDVPDSHPVSAITDAVEEVQKPLANINDIVQTNKTDGSFLSMGLSSNGTLYFGSNYNEGIWKLDSSGNIVPTNKTNGIFNSMGLSSDGTLYFGGNPGIWKLDNSGNIVLTNKTDGFFGAIGLSSDGTLYFCSSSNNQGIWKLDNSGTIVPTNKTTGTFNRMRLNSDGTLYFVSGIQGIWKLPYEKPKIYGRIYGEWQEIKVVAQMI